MSNPKHFIEITGFDGRKIHLDSRRIVSVSIKPKSCYTELQVACERESETWLVGTSVTDVLRLIAEAQKGAA